MEQKQRSGKRSSAPPSPPREYAYAPYSRFQVGAALLAKNGTRLQRLQYRDMPRYTPTNCAERTALFKAVSEGEREFTAIAIVGSKDGGEKHPCHRPLRGLPPGIVRVRRPEPDRYHGQERGRLHRDDLG